MFVLGESPSPGPQYTIPSQRTKRLKNNMSPLRINMQLNDRQQQPTTKAQKHEMNCPSPIQALMSMRRDSPS